MSGHSHYATTHRQKEVNDAAKGKVFSKLARTITIAAKTGGGPNPDFNFKLRIAIDKARAASMPKENIERALAKAEMTGELEEVRYEGFGPAGAFVLVDAATDNRNRTNAEIKNLFEKNGGKMGTPGSVAFNFDVLGMLVVKKNENKDEQMLKLIDLGAIDVAEEDSVLVVYVKATELSNMHKKLTENGLTVTEAEIVEKPKNLIDLPEAGKEKLAVFINNFEEQEDVQKVFTNVDL